MCWQSMRVLLWDDDDSALGVRVPWVHLAVEHDAVPHLVFHAVLQPVDPNSALGGWRHEQVFEVCPAVAVLREQQLVLVLKAANRVGVSYLVVNVSSAAGPRNYRKLCSISLVVTVVHQ